MGNQYTLYWKRGEGTSGKGGGERREGRGEGCVWIRGWERMAVTILYLVALLFARLSAGTDVGEIGNDLLGVFSLTGAGFTAKHTHT